MGDFRKQLTTRLLITGGILLVALVFIGLMSRAITRVADRALDLRRELALKESAIGSLASLKADAVRAEAPRPRLEEQLPPKDWVFNFSNAMAGFARERKVSARASLVGEAPETDTMPAGFFFEIAASADYPTLVLFLRGLAQHPLLIRFTNVDLVRSSRDTFDAAIKGRVFSQ